MKFSFYKLQFNALEQWMNDLKQKYPWIDWSLVTLEIAGRDYLQIHYNQNTYNLNGPAISLDDYSIHFPEEK